MIWKPNPEAKGLLNRPRASHRRHRDRLLAVKRSEVPWADVNVWRKELHRDFERALAETNLAERPDYEAANRFLVKAQRLVVSP
jgi:hypothetical protein